MKLQITKSKNATTPTYGTSGAAGMDLYSAEDVVINPGDTRLIDTGVAFAIPEGFVGLVVPRSGLSLMTGLRQPNCVGVIDCDYRGRVHGMFQNTGSKPIAIEKGVRFAQMVIVPYVKCDIEVVDVLTATERGANGFGSTGL